MVAVALVLLVEEHSNLWLTLPAAIIIGREIVVSALREWMAELGARAQVAVSNLGKWKTAAQMVALVILLAIRRSRQYGSAWGTHCSSSRQG